MAIRCHGDSQCFGCSARNHGQQKIEHENTSSHFGGIDSGIYHKNLDGSDVVNRQKGSPEVTRVVAFGALGMFESACKV